MKKFIICVSVILALLVAVWVVVFYRTPKVVISTSPKPVMFFVETARSEEEKARGLMYRTSLPENRGMLFYFNDEAVRSFWMKNTLIPLDIIFADSQGRIVSVKTMEPCRTGVCPDYSSGAPAKYALEINAGLAQKFGIEPGEQMTVEGD